MGNQIRKLGVTRACIARYLGVNRATVTRWCKTGAPQHVIRHMEILISYQDALDAVRNA